MNPLARKLQIKPGSRIALVNPPAGYAERLEPLPDGAELVDLQPGLDVVAVDDTWSAMRFRPADQVGT